MAVPRGVVVAVACGVPVALGVRVAVAVAFRVGAGQPLGEAVEALRRLPAADPDLGTDRSLETQCGSGYAAAGATLGELLGLPEVSAATVVGAREYEISVEISEQLLREYHLTLGDVANIIAASSLDIPAGSVQTRNGDIMLRTLGQAYVQQDFEDIVLRTWPDGTRLLLGDIATITDGYADTDQASSARHSVATALPNGARPSAVPKATSIPFAQPSPP